MKTVPSPPHSLQTHTSPDTTLQNGLAFHLHSTSKDTKAAHPGHPHSFSILPSLYNRENINLFSPSKTNPTIDSTRKKINIPTFRLKVRDLPAPLTSR
jgi:hypothetical protein